MRFIVHPGLQLHLLYDVLSRNQFVGWSMDPYFVDSIMGVLPCPKQKDRWTRKEVHLCHTNSSMYPPLSQQQHAFVCAALKKFGPFNRFGPVYVDQPKYRS